MITKQRLKKAEQALEHAHQSAITAHECYALLIKSHKKLLKNLQKSGISRHDAIIDFEELMQEHSQRFNEAMATMEKLSKEFNSLENEYQHQAA
jgi:chromosome segregation ATPase